MKALHAIVLAFALAGSAVGQTVPQPGPGDPRLQTIVYVPDQVVRLQGVPGYQITIALGADERIETVSVGDSGAWSVTANKRGDHLFVKPVSGGVATNMVVVTDLRLYAFELVPATGPIETLPFAIRFVFPSGTDAPAAAAPAAGAEAIVGRYKLGGDRLLRPEAMSDDGTHTSLQWPASATLPAIYAVGRDSRETLVTGQVRGGVVVIDGIAQRYVFRLDARTARARRVVPRADR